jgi:hypothetical protein
MPRLSLARRGLPRRTWHASRNQLCLSCCASKWNPPITIDTPKVFQAFLDTALFDGFNLVVALNSNGGSLLGGMQLGQMIREGLFDTEVDSYARDPASEKLNWNGQPGKCFSACALAFLGGERRKINPPNEIGFHQFSGAGSNNVDAEMIRTQHFSGLVSMYLRGMGAEPELFELMSTTSPDSIFVPTQDELAILGIIPTESFHDFRLMPKDGIIVATAINDLNPVGLERVHEIETMCWKGTPIVNLYATGPERGLELGWIKGVGPHITGFKIQSDFGNIDYGRENLRLYEQSKILATLIIEPVVARALGNGSASIWVNTYTASGVFMSGHISAPSGGDQAILASFRDCVWGPLFTSPDPRFPDSMALCE